MRKTKIFIVDDSVVARKMLVRILSERDDYEIIGESSSAQGFIILLDECEPDVVMLEAGISGGMTISHAIKEIKKISPDTKIVLCSDPISTNQRVIIPSMEIGVDDFIEKPYKKAKIFRVIDEFAVKGN